MARTTLNDAIHFRCSNVEKMELEEVAARNGMTLGELMRKGMKTIKVIFGDDISIGDLIIMSDVLLEKKSRGRPRPDERSSSHPGMP
jgi:hypothetical protein